MFAGVAALAISILACSCGDGNGTDGGDSARPTVSCSSAGDGVKVEWTTVKGALSYEVQYADNSGMSGATSLEASGTSLVIDEDASSTVFYIRVRARLGSGWGEWSDTVSYSASRAKIVVETYNILSETVVDKAPWPNRKEAWKENVLKESNFPDILGLQEGRSDKQRNEIIEMLREYYNYYVCPNTDISPTLILWKKDRFMLVSTEVVDMLPGSVAAYNKTSRYALHVRLKERSTGQELLVYNIHTPAATSLSTDAKVKLHNEMISTLAPYAKAKSEETGIPVIVMGDMNCYPTTVANGIPGSIPTFKNHGFRDTYDMTTNRTNHNYGTYNSQANVDNCTANYAANGANRLDYIMLWPESSFKVNSYEIIINFTDQTTHKVQCPLPSDHNPVRVELEVK